MLDIESSFMYTKDIREKSTQFSKIACSIVSYGMGVPEGLGIVDVFFRQWAQTSVCEGDIEEGLEG